MNESVNDPGLDGRFQVCCINRHQNVIYSTSGGAAMINEGTDSRFVNIYLSGGSGSWEAGGNNDYSAFMVDHSSAYGLRIAPLVNRTTQSINLINGNFQRCITNSLIIDNGGATAGFSHGSVISGININNTTTSGASISIIGSQNVTITGLIDEQLGAASVLADANSDYLTIIGHCNGSVTVPGINSTVILDGAVTVGTLALSKQAVAPAVAPGAGRARMFVVAGTNAGSAKLQMIAGTSATPVTIMDNIGVGF